MLLPSNTKPRNSSKWKEYEIKDFIGVRQDDSNPPPNSASDILNLDLINKRGALTLRDGRQKKLDTPVDAFLWENPDGDIKATFENNPRATSFFIMAENGEEKEIFVFVQPTKIGVTDDSDDSEINGFAVFVNPHYDSSLGWQEGWEELTSCAYFKALATGTNFILNVNYTPPGDAWEDKMEGWHVINMTTGATSRIVHTYKFSGTGQLRFKITSNVSAFASAGDDILVMKNYFPHEYFKGNGSATYSEISFTKVLRGIRISFGGRDNRLAASVDFVKNYLPISGFGAGSDADFSAGLDAVATTNGFVLTPYTEIESDAYRFDPYPVYEDNLSGISPDRTVYKFIYTAVLDGASEVPVGEYTYDESGETEQTNAYLRGFIPRINVDISKFNKRLTDVNVYASRQIDGTNEFTDYYKAWNIPIRRETSTGAYVCGKDSFLPFYDESELVQFHDENNAVVPADGSGGAETDGTNGWEMSDGSTPTVFSYGWDNASGTYFYDLDLGETIIYRKDITTLLPDRFYKRYRIQISFDVQAVGTREGLPEYLDSTFAFIRVATHGASKEFTVRDQKTRIFWDPMVSDYRATDRPEFNRGIFLNNNEGELWVAITAKFAHDVYIDNVSIRVGEAPVIDNESIERSGTPLSVALEGGNLGEPLVKSWDSSTVTGGRMYVANPYIDKRYEDYIFFSPIGETNASYDYIPLGNFLNTKSFDGDYIMRILPWRGNALLGLRRGSAVLIDATTGQTKDVYGESGLLNPRACDVVGDNAFWLGWESVEIFNGGNVRDVSTGGIGDSYSDIVSSTETFIASASAVAGKKRTLRFYARGTSTGIKEYVLSDRGWAIEEGYAVVDYIPTANGAYYTFDPAEDKIFEQVPGESDWGGPLVGYDDIDIKWESAWIDIETMGGVITSKKFMYVDSVWFFYKASAASSAITGRLYVNDDSLAYDSWSMSTADTGGYVKKIKRVKRGAVGHRIKIGIDGTIAGDDGGVEFEMISCGVLVKDYHGGQFRS